MAGLSREKPETETEQNQTKETMKKLIALLAAAFIAAPVLADSEFPDISVAELEKAIAEKKVTVIDVNGSSSYKKGHVPTAIDYATTSKELASKLPSDKGALVVAYCGGPSCSAYKKAANAAKELGYTNVKHLSAGISGWLQAGKTTEKAD